MSKTRRSAIFAILALAAACAFGAAPSGSSFNGDRGAADVVVLLDSSQSTLPYFQDVTDYVITSVVRDFLRFGDSFHLLSFGDQAQVEVSERIVQERDVKSVLGRLYLLYPLARHTDFVGALRYLYQYLADLPTSRPKVVVVITDGIHNPAPGSPTYGLPPERVASEVEAVSAKIRANGWPVHFIKLPFPAVVASHATTAAESAKSKGADSANATGAAAAESAKAKGAASASAAGGGATTDAARAADAKSAAAQAEAKPGTSYLETAAKTLGADISPYSEDSKADLARMSLSLPSLAFPGPLGKRDLAFSFPLTITNAGSVQLGVELERVKLGESDILAKKSFLTLPAGKSGVLDVSVLLPEAVGTGDKRLDVELFFANGLRTIPQSGTLSLTIVKNPLSALFRSSARIFLFAILLVLGLAAVLAVVLVLRRIPRRAEEPVVAAVLAGGDTSVGARGAAVAPPMPRRPVEPTALPVGGTERPAQAPSAAEKAEAAPSALARDGAAERALSEAASSASAEMVARTGAADEAAHALEAARREETARGAALLAEAAGRPRPPLPALSRPHQVAEQPKVARPGTIQIELLVEDQNPHVGLRNVHTMHAGTTKSLGGGRSDFLVFLLPVPSRAAQIHFDGEDLTLLPLRPELFPDAEGAAIPRCLGKPIRMLSASGYPLVIRLERYVKPADRINRLLHCIEAPGIFDESTN